MTKTTNQNKVTKNQEEQHKDRTAQNCSTTSELTTDVLVGGRFAQWRAHTAMHYCVKLSYPWTWILLLPCYICLVRFWEWMRNLLTWVLGLEPGSTFSMRQISQLMSWSGDRFAQLRAHIVIHHGVKLSCPLHRILLLPCRIYLVSLWEWMIERLIWALEWIPSFHVSE